MKKGWEYKKLGDVTTFQNGFAFKSSLFRKDGLPIVRISSIQDEIIKEDDLVSFYPSDYDVNFDNYKILPNDILIAMSGGTTGKLGINRSNKVFYQNQRVGVIRENKKVLNHLFLYYFLHTKSEESLKIAAGAAQPNLSTAQIKSFLIPVPPLSEQQSIVDYLDSAFAKIDAMKANAEKALNEAKALFQASLKEMLEPKEGWEEKKLIQEFSLKSGENLSAKNQVIGPYPVYGGNGITGYHNQYNLSGDQILIGRVGALCGNIHYIKERIWVTDNAFVVNNISSSWNMLFLSYELEYINLNQYASQTAQPVISNKSMKDVSIFQPSLSEQQSIVATLDSLKSKVDRLQANYEKISQECDALKQAILRKVFE